MLRRVVKGCQIAIYNIVFFASEIQYLQAMNIDLKRKQETPR